MKQHTPGPWHANTPRTERYASGSTIRDAEGACVAVVHTCYQGSTIANARLIAAAPDLLEALQKAADCYENITSEDFSLGMDKGIREWMRAAIAKAAGDD